jgi:hypothetical protein
MSMPFLQTLDVDEDGIISAEEIKSAPSALKKLDKNNDGQLPRDEWQPRPPQSDGQRERPAGARDSEQRKPGPRDGERPRGGPRDGEAKAPEAKLNEAPLVKKGDADAGRERLTGDAPGKNERPPAPPAPPLLEALDADRNGTISEEEISKSPESLGKLDKNNDGQLGPREYGPRPPQGPPPRRESGKDAGKVEGNPPQ